MTPPHDEQDTVENLLVSIHGSVTHLREFSYLVIGCFEPSQSQRIVSGFKETFIKRDTVERTSKAEIRPGKQSEKMENCRENLWNEIQLKGP